MLAQRLATAAAGIPIILAVILIGGPLYTAVVAVILGLGSLEFVHMLAGVERPPWRPSGAAIVAVAAVVAVVVGADNGVDYWTGAVVAGVGLGLVYVVALRTTEDAPGDWLTTLGAVVYIGFLGSYLVLLRDLDKGEHWVLLAVLGTWGADTCAYATGKAVGRHRMAPRISPGKTWEGTIGALAGGLVIVALLNWPLDLPMSAGQGIILGLLLPVVAVLADLGESMLKRGAGVKDTSALVPGHGGFLDRLDSILFTVPLVYYFAIWVVL